MPHRDNAPSEEFLAEGEASLLELFGPEYSFAYRELHRVARRRCALTPVERELVMLSVNVAVHLYDVPGVRFHIRRALDAGATVPEVVGAFRVGGMGQQTHVKCGPILLEELERAGLMAPPTEEIIAAETEFTRWIREFRGFPGSGGTGWDSILRLDPDYLRAYQNLAGLGLLPPRLGELTVIAADIATTNLHVPGARSHVKRSLSIGITKDDLIELFEIVSLVGYKTALLGAGVVRDELARREAGSREDTASSDGYLAENEDALLERMEPRYRHAYQQLQEVVRRKDALSAVEREIALLAVNAAIHLYDLPGIRFHVRRALDAGATVPEVLGAFRVGGMGQQTHIMCTPMLLEELEQAGLVLPPSAELLASEKEFKGWVRTFRGFWDEEWSPILRLDPEFLRAYQHLAGIGLLPPRLGELVVIAANVATTNLNVSGTRTHVRRGIEIGLSKDDLVELFELVSTVGYKSVFLGIGTLEDELVRREGTASEPLPSSDDFLADGEAGLPELMGPKYYKAYRELQAAVRRKNALSPVERELVMLAINVAVHLYDPPGVRFHIRCALDAGATVSQVLGAFRVGGMGQQTHVWCTPVLLEELERAGLAAPPSPDVLASEAEFIEWVREFRGFWGGAWAAILRLDPEYLRAYQDLAGLGLLPPRLGELVVIAADAATTNLEVPGVRTHVRRALELGVGKDDLIELFELLSTIGYKSTFLGVAAVRDELARRDESSRVRAQRDVGRQRGG